MEVLVHTPMYQLHLIILPNGGPGTYSNVSVTLLLPNGGFGTYSNVSIALLLPCGGPGTYSNVSVALCLPVGRHSLHPIMKQTAMTDNRVYGLMLITDTVYITIAVSQTHREGCQSLYIGNAHVSLHVVALYFKIDYYQTMVRTAHSLSKIASIIANCLHRYIDSHHNYDKSCFT